MSTAEQMRAWKGPVILSYGFRPMFLLAGIWGLLAMALWIGMLTGALTLPTAFDPVSWHAHEFLFGYASAVIAGFLLTAVPNWTGRLPVVGWPLGGLALVWLLGRGMVAVSAVVPLWAAAVADLAFPTLLAAVILREIVAGKNWKNLIVLAMLLVFVVANAIYWLEAATGGYPAQGTGLRLGLGTAIMMISVIGGRIVPSFTRNWLAQRSSSHLPAAPMQRFDKITLLVTLITLAAWVMLPLARITGAALLVMALLHLIRLGRWQGHRTLAEPLLTVLHLGYLLVPLGAVLLGAAIVMPDSFGAAAAQHVWMAGAIALMTLAVMTRATLGHSGRALRADIGTSAIYACVVAALLCRLGGGIYAESAMTYYWLSALFWLCAYGGFLGLYAQLLIFPAAKH